MFIIIFLLLVLWINIWPIMGFHTMQSEVKTEKDKKETLAAIAVYAFTLYVTAFLAWNLGKGWSAFYGN